MADQVLLYISAATDLRFERDLLGRAVTEIPTTLGWRIVLSPEGNGLVDEAAVYDADVHLLLLGSDIRAPIGWEWILARRVGRMPWLFLKQGIHRTTAAERFRQEVAAEGTWCGFAGGDDLRRRVLEVLTAHILDRAVHYVVRPDELLRLQAFQAGLDKTTAPEEAYGGTGESSVILSRERFVPSDGVLIDPNKQRS